MTLRINQMTSAVSRTLVVAGQEKKIVFTSGEVSSATDGSGTRIPFLQIAGVNTTLSIADTVELRGNVTFTRDTNRFLVGSNNFEAFIGKGPARLSDGSTNPDAVGLLISNIQLALAVFTGGPLVGKFAFDGQGTVGFLGLPGLQVGLNAVNATFGLRLNRTGQAITPAINVPVITAINATTGENTYTTVPLSFADGSDIAQFKAGVRINFDINSKPVFDMSGMMLIRQLPGGEADVTVTGLTPTNRASLKIYSGSTEGF